jgi:hypothetical protein
MSRRVQGYLDVEHHTKMCQMLSLALRGPASPCACHVASVGLVQRLLQGGILKDIFSLLQTFSTEVRLTARTTGETMSGYWSPMCLRPVSSLLVCPSVSMGHCFSDLRHVHHVAYSQGEIPVSCQPTSICVFNLHLTCCRTHLHMGASLEDI